MSDLPMIILLAGVVLLLPLILSVAAIIQVSGLRRKVDDLKEQLLSSRQSPAPRTEPLAAAVDSPVAAAERPRKSNWKKSKAALALEAEQDLLKAPATEPMSPTIEPTPFVEPEPATPFSAPRNMEQALASRWFVWIGGAAIALAGLLFVKYAFDNQLISPTLQIFLALAVALGLSILGDRMRPHTADAKNIDYVPAALSAAGLAIAFGAVFASYALYNLIPPAAAFIGLIALGLIALGLSLRQGPFIAALGLAGSYVTPTLITSHAPNAWTFFPFLLIIMAASFAVLRKRPWWWLGYASIAGSAAWAILWFNGPYVYSDVLPLGLFILAFGAIAFSALRGKEAFAEHTGSLLHPTQMSPPLQLGAVGAGTAGLVLSLLVFKANHSMLALSLFGIGMAAISVFSWVKRGPSTAMLAAAALTFFTLFVWPEVANSEFGAFSWHSTILNEVSAAQFLRLMLFAGAAFGALGLAGFFRKQHSGTWAILAAAAPVSFLVGARLQVHSLMSENLWAICALGIAVVLLAAIYIRRSKLEHRLENDVSGYLAMASAAAAAFACVELFEDIWLTMAMAALALVFAALTKPLPVRMLGSIAAGLGTLTAGRLFLSRELWSDNHDLPWGKHWPLYGYGLPVVFLWIASRLLKKIDNQRATTGLEAISLGLLISLVSLELRVLIGGGVNQDGMTLLELSTHILAWMGAAFGLVYRQSIYSSFVSLWGSRLLLAASAFALIFFSMGLLNPIASGDPIEGGPIINTLWLAYLAPVVLLSVILRSAPNAGLEKWRNALGILALVLLLSFVTLEVKRLFQGPMVQVEFLSDAESYAMSAAWLVVAILLFVTGLSWNRKTIRYGGLAVMILALLKTFGYDLWQLGGLWQIASVMGIGLSLVGMGWLYTRFIRPIEQKSV